MKLIQELMSLNEGAEKAAAKLGKSTGAKGHAPLSKAALMKSYGSEDAVKAYMDAYKEAKVEYDRKEEGDAWREKDAARRQGRNYHE